MTSPPNCCLEISFAIEGPAKFIDVTKAGTYQMHCHDGITHRISFCPFCGASFESKQFLEHVYPAADQTVLKKISLIKSFDSLCQVIGGPDEELEVEEGTAVQYSFNHVLQSGVIVTIVRRGSDIEVLAIPHEP